MKNMAWHVWGKKTFGFKKGGWTDCGGIRLEFTQLPC